jgi:hypothetical protein
MGNGEAGWRQKSWGVAAHVTLRCLLGLIETGWKVVVIFLVGYSGGNANTSCFEISTVVHIQNSPTPNGL